MTQSATVTRILSILMDPPVTIRASARRKRACFFRTKPGAARKIGRKNGGGHASARSNSPQPVSSSATWHERALLRSVRRCTSSYYDIVVGLEEGEQMALVDDSVVRTAKEIRRSAAETQLGGTLEEIGDSSGVLFRPDKARFC